MAPMSQHFKKVWMAQNWILACGDQPVLPLHSSRSSSHWTQMTLEGKLKLNAPQMESSKNWMRCLVSALCSFLHRERKQEVNPPLPTRDTWKQVIFSLYFYWTWDFMLFTSPWAGTALAGLSVGWCPGEAAWALLRASLPSLHWGHHCASQDQPGLPEDGFLAGSVPTCSECGFLLQEFGGVQQKYWKIKCLWGWKTVGPLPLRKHICSLHVTLYLPLCDSSHTW